MNLKLSDFGMSARLEFEGDKKHSICGTPNFIAPEIVNYALNMPKSISGHSFEVDLWSIGAVLYTLLIGDCPFESDDRVTTYERVSIG